MNWPPQVGEPVSRAEDAWYEWRKVQGWVLSGRGHGPEWSTVFHVGLVHWTLVRNALVEAAMGASIQIVHDRSPFGFTCGIDVELTINGRSALVTLALHYAEEDSPPRLVTAYPNL